VKKKPPKTPRASKVPLMLRLDPEDAERLDKLASRVRFASKTALAIEAIRIGLDEIEENPARLLGPV
jgi:predicted DNA-binding protein